jgi:hypothetical protein
VAMGCDNVNFNTLTFKAYDATKRPLYTVILNSVRSRGAAFGG